MYGKERQGIILEIIRKQGFATVAQLTAELHYSTATINRDLNALEKQHLIKRSYGGAEATSELEISHTFRTPKMRRSKRKIAAFAAALVEDGEFIFIDGGTTPEYMSEFLREKKNLTVLTNNNLLATELFSYGIQVICLGGEIIEEPCITGGELCLQNAASYRVDKAFFSVGAISHGGEVSMRVDFYRTIRPNTRQIWLLADKQKIDLPARNVVCDLSEMSGVISDYDFPQETKAAYPETRFVCTEEEEGTKKGSAL